MMPDSSQPRLFRFSNASALGDALLYGEQPLHVQVPGQLDLPCELFLGSYAAATNRMALDRLGITHIINVTWEYENTFPDAYTYLRIPAKDTRNERLRPYFKEVAAFVADAQAHDPNARVIFHCQHGISRSVTLLVATIMHAENLSLEQVLRPLTLLKPEVEPNPAFMNELRAWEAELFGNVTSTMQLTVSDPLYVDQGPRLSTSYEAALALASMEAVDHLVPATRVEACQQAVTALLSLPEPERDGAIVHIIKGIVEAYGARGLREERGRSSVGSILRMLMEQGGIDVHSLERVFDAVLEDELWQDFVLDVPYADDYLRTMRAECSMYDTLH
jgi:hypothetical protein